MLPLVGLWEIRMGTLEFIAALVEDTLTVATIFRGPISLLPFLQRLRYKEFVVEFNQKLDKVETEAAAITGEGTEGVDDYMLELAQAHPRGAVIDSSPSKRQYVMLLPLGTCVDDPRRRSTAVEKNSPVPERSTLPSASGLQRSGSQARMFLLANSRNGPAICLSSVKGGRSPRRTECHSSPGRRPVGMSQPALLITATVTHGGDVVPYRPLRPALRCLYDDPPVSPYTMKLRMTTGMKAIRITANARKVEV